jgi:LysR family hydrogen peroxide-inducible transcriptional activator
MQIQKLEDQLGVVIFDRSKHPVIPTDIGIKIISQAREVVNESKRLQEIIENEKDEIAGELTIGVIPTISPYLLPLFINDFITKYPKVRLTVREMVTGDVLENMNKGLLDVGLIVTPTGDSNFKEIPIFYEEFMGYVGHRHSLSVKETLSIEDVGYDDLWLLNEGHCFRNQVLNICHPDPLQEKNKKFKYESGSLEALKRIVDQHGGMTLLPELATLDFDTKSKQKLRPFEDPKPIREISLVVKRSFVKRKLVEALYESIKNSIPEYLNSEKNGKVIKWK